VSANHPTEPSTSPAEEPAAATEARAPERRPYPLRGSRTSGIWVAVLALALLLLLLAVFILQNTQKVEISFFGWNGHAPLAASLLIAAVAGALSVASAGMLRILQLRRRVKRERKR
jgi:uncharacterized integral membrane protein